MAGTWTSADSGCEKDNERSMRHTEIVTAHGGGGLATEELLREVILPPLQNSVLNTLDDGALIARPEGDLCFTTDGYVVKPIIFPGGTIGDLAVCGTVNDLAVMGADPQVLSLSLILDEGLPITTLRTVMESIARSAEAAGVQIVTGDTKVIDRSGKPGMTITTAGIGVLRENCRWSMAAIQPGDVILINGFLGDHGLAIMGLRENLQFSSSLKSDVAPLNGLLNSLIDASIDVRFTRDCTRAGLAGVLADISESSQLSLTIDEAALPISRTARHTAEMLGLDPLNVANEGKIVVVVNPQDAESALEILRSHRLGKEAAIIGKVSEDQPALAELSTKAGGRRIIQKPFGEDLPRIC